MGGVALKTYKLLAVIAALALSLSSRYVCAEQIPDKTVVLTFDDAVKSQVTVVAPLLEQLGFKATFFITHNWMEDKSNFLSWEEVADLNRRGFEIGNHTWTHSGFETEEKGATLGEELEMVEAALARVGVPKPVSFAWPGDNFGPEALKQLQMHGYKVARRGMQPEVPYGEIQVGPALDVKKNYPLLIPTAGDAYPDWTFEHFKKVVASAKRGKIVVLQFHGVPDPTHPWVNTPPEMFKQYMQYLKENGYRAIAMRDLIPYFDWSHLPDDPLMTSRVVAVRKK